MAELYLEVQRSPASLLFSVFCELEDVLFTVYAEKGVLAPWCRSCAGMKCKPDAELLILQLRIVTSHSKLTVHSHQPPQASFLLLKFGPGDFEDLFMSSMRFQVKSEVLRKLKSCFLSTVSYGAIFLSSYLSNSDYAGVGECRGSALREAGRGASFTHSPFSSSALPATHVPAPHHEGNPRDQAMASALLTADSQVSHGPLFPLETLDWPFLGHLS